MTKIYSIHDKTFKHSMADLRVARDFFETHLPKEVLSLVDLKTLRMDPSSFVDKQHNAFSSDILYEVIRKDNALMCLYILAEHQSTVDAFMAFRLWNYIFKIWCYYRKKNPKATKLPLIFPLVFYHGQEEYQDCKNLAGLIEGPLDLIKSVLFQDFHLVDTHKISDEELREQHWSGIMTFMMKHVYARDVWPLIQPLIEMLKTIENEEGAISYVQNLLYYWIVKAETKQGPKAFIEAVQQGLSMPIQGELMSMAEQLIQEGMQQGEGALLVRLLERKFTNLPEEYRDKIKQANAEKLLIWGERVLDMTQLEEIFV